MVELQKSKARERTTTHALLMARGALRECQGGIIMPAGIDQRARRMICGADTCKYVDRVLARIDAILVELSEENAND